MKPIRHLESIFMDVRRIFLETQKDFDYALSLNGYEVKYNFKIIKKSNKGQLRIKYFVQINISLLDNKGTISAEKDESKSFWACLATAVKKNDDYKVKQIDKNLLNVYLKRILKDTQKSNKFEVFEDDSLDRFILVIYRLYIGDLTDRERNILKIVELLVFILFVLLMVILYGKAIIRSDEYWYWGNYYLCFA